MITPFPRNRTPSWANVVLTITREYPKIRSCKGSNPTSTADCDVSDTEHRCPEASFTPRVVFGSPGLGRVGVFGVAHRRCWGRGRLVKCVREMEAELKSRSFGRARRCALGRPDGAQEMTPSRRSRSTCSTVVPELSKGARLDVKPTLDLGL